MRRAASRVSIRAGSRESRRWEALQVTRALQVFQSAPALERARVIRRVAQSVSIRAGSRESRRLAQNVEIEPPPGFQSASRATTRS